MASALSLLCFSSFSWLVHCHSCALASSNSTHSFHCIHSCACNAVESHSCSSSSLTPVNADPRSTPAKKMLVAPFIHSFIHSLVDCRRFDALLLASSSNVRSGVVVVVALCVGSCNFRLVRSGVIGCCAHILLKFDGCRHSCASALVYYCCRIAC